MVLGLHSCPLELNISSKSRPGLFHPTFCRSDSAKVNTGMNFEDLSEGLRISSFILNLHVGDQAVSTPKTVSIGIKPDQSAVFTIPSVSV